MMAIPRQKTFLILLLILLAAGYILLQAHNIISNNDTYNYILSGLYNIDAQGYQEVLDQFIDSCPNLSCQAYELSTIAPRYYYNYPVFGLLIQLFYYLDVSSAVAIIGSIGISYLFIYYKIFRSINDEILNFDLLPLLLGFFNPVFVFIRCLGFSAKSWFLIFIVCVGAFLCYKNFGYSLSIVRYVSIYWALYIFYKYTHGKEIVFSDFVMLYSHLLVGVLVSVMLLIVLVDFSSIKNRLKGDLRQLFIAVIILVGYMGAFFSNPAFPIGSLGQRFLVILIALTLIALAIFASATFKKYLSSFFSNFSYTLFKIFGSFLLLGITYYVNKGNYHHKIFLLDYFLIPVTYMAIGFVAIEYKVKISPTFIAKLSTKVEKYRLVAILLFFIFISTKVFIHFEKGVTEPFNSYISSFTYDEQKLSQLDIGMLRRLLLVRYVYER